MNYEKFTDKSQGTLQQAQTFALARGHQRFLPEHILHALLNDPDNIAENMITSAGGKIARIKEGLAQEIARIPRVEGSGAGGLVMAPETARLMEAAEQLAKKSKDDFVTQERLLQAVAMTAGSAAAKLLTENGATPQALNKAVDTMRKGRPAQSSNAESTFNALKKYTKDLTALAKLGKLDPVIGREEEIRRTMQVLSRRTKNNPVLIGEPGVGKTAIIEGIGLAHHCGRRAGEPKGPPSAGARHGLADRRRQVSRRVRGAFESRAGRDRRFRWRGCSFYRRAACVGGSRTDGRRMDASNLLKPALARGELHCVGATTLDEYRKYIEKDAALARRFQSVFVSEPSVEDTISILRGLKEKYELHHGIRITDSAVVAAATLANRYITDRFLPDKAIDLVDEAASRLRMEVDSKPEEIDELDRRVMQLKIEREALKKEVDPASLARLEKLNAELRDVEMKNADLTSKWNAEKTQMHGIQKLKEQIEEAQRERDIAQREGKLSRAGEIVYSVIPRLSQQLQQAETLTRSALLKETVSPEDIAAIVSRWTGIPVEKMLTGEREKLLHMEDHLRARVVGQEEAVVAVANAVRRSRAGLSDAARPIGSFMFLGPTGVGKTELSKALATFLFDDDTALLTIDMSEYMEKHAVSRLIGAPPGYVGYDQGGTLTEAVRRRPYQVILFDEVEKAHPDVFNVLLQVLDEGRLTDGQGRVVDFKNTIIVLTSNIGSQVLAEQKEDEELTGRMRDQVMESLRKHFRPEFLNRLDEILIFHRLGRGNMHRIVDIQVGRLAAGWRTEISGWCWRTRRGTGWAEVGYDPVYGARPLKRVIQRTLENKLAQMMLEGRIADNQEAVVMANKEGLEIGIRARSVANPPD